MPVIDTFGNFNIRGVAEPAQDNDAVNRQYVNEQSTADRAYTDTQVSGATRTSFFTWTGVAPIIPLDVYRFQEENFLYLGPEVTAYTAGTAYAAGDHALFNGDVYEALSDVPSAAFAPVDIDFFGTWSLADSGFGPGEFQHPGGGDIVLTTGAQERFVFNSTDADGVNHNADLTTLTTGDILYVYDTSGDLVVILTFTSYLVGDTAAPRYTPDRNVTLTTGTSYSLRWGGDGLWNDVGPIEPDASSPNWEIVGLDLSDAVGMNSADISALTTVVDGKQNTVTLFASTDTYAIGDIAFISSGLLYRNLTGTAGTDPSMDTTNWMQIGGAEDDDSLFVTRAFYDANTGITVHHATSGTAINADFSGESGGTREADLVITTDGDYTIAVSIEITSIIGNFAQGQWRVTLRDANGDSVASRNISENSDDGETTKNLTANGLTAQTYTLTVTLSTNNNVNGWAVQATATTTDHNSVDVDPLVYEDLDTRYLQSADLSPYRALTDQAIGTVPYRSPFNPDEWSSIVQPGAFDRPIVLEDAVEIEAFPTIGTPTTSGFASFGAVLADNGTNAVVLADSGFLSGDDDVYDVYTLGTTAQLIFYVGAGNSISVGQRIDIVQNSAQNTAITTNFSVADFIVDSVQTIGSFQRVVADSTRDARRATALTINADLGSGVAGIDSFLTAQGIPVVRFVATASIDTDGGESLADAYLQSYDIHDGLTRFAIPLAIRDEDYNRVDRVDSLVFDNNPVPRRITDALEIADGSLTTRIDQLEGSGTLGPQGEDGLSYLVLYNNNADDNPPNQPESRVTGSDLWESTNQGRVETNTFEFTGDQTGGRWHAADYIPAAETNELTFTGSTLGTVTTPGLPDQPNAVEINFTGRGGSTSVTTPIDARPEIADVTFSGTSSSYPTPFKPGIFDAVFEDITGSEGMWVSTGGLYDNDSRHTLALSNLARPTGDPSGQTRLLVDKVTQEAASYYAGQGPHGFVTANVMRNVFNYINGQTADNDGAVFTTEEKAQAAAFVDTTTGFTPFRTDAGGVSTDWAVQMHCWPANNYIRIGLTGPQHFDDAPNVRFIDTAATLYLLFMMVKYNLRSTITTTFNGNTINGIFDWADAVSEYNTLEPPTWIADTETLHFVSTEDTRSNAGWAIANGQLVSSDETGTTQSRSVTTHNIALTSLQEPSGTPSTGNAITANHVVSFNRGYEWLGTGVADDAQDSVFFEFVNNLGYRSVTPAFDVFDTVNDTVDDPAATTYSPAAAAAVIHGKLATWLAETDQLAFFGSDVPTLAFGSGETYFQVLIDNPTDNSLMSVGVSRARSAAEFEGHVIEEALTLSVELNGVLNGVALNDANRGTIQVANFLFDESAVTYSEYLLPLLSNASASDIALFADNRISRDPNIDDTFDTTVNGTTLRFTARADGPQGDMSVRITGSSASSLSVSAVNIQQGSLDVGVTTGGTVSSFTFSIDRDFHQQLLADSELPGAITSFSTDSNNITTYTIQNPAGIRAENVAINFRNFINAVFDGFDTVEYSSANSIDATVRLVSSETEVSGETELSPLVNITEPGTGGTLGAINAVTAGRAGTADVTTGHNPTVTFSIDPVHHSVDTLVVDLPAFASAEASANAIATYFIDNPQYEYVVSTVASTPNVVTLTSETPGAEIDMVGEVFAGSVNNDMTAPGSLALVIDITQGADSGSPIFNADGEGSIVFTTLDENHRTTTDLTPYDLNLIGSRIGLRYLIDFVDTDDVTTEDLVVSWSYPVTNRARTATEINVSGHINVASGTSLEDFTTTLIDELNASIASNILVDIDLDDYILARTTQPAIGDLHLQALGARVDLVGEELVDSPITGLGISYSGINFSTGTDNTFLTIQAGSFNDTPEEDTTTWRVQSYAVRDVGDITTEFSFGDFLLNLEDGLFYRYIGGSPSVYVGGSNFPQVEDWSGTSSYGSADFVSYRGNAYIAEAAVSALTAGALNPSPDTTNPPWVAQTIDVTRTATTVDSYADGDIVLNTLEDPSALYVNSSGSAADFAGLTPIPIWSPTAGYVADDFVSYLVEGDTNPTPYQASGSSGLPIPALDLIPPTDGPTLTAANDEPRLIVHPSVQTVLDDLATQANNLTANNDFGFRATTTTTELILQGVNREAEEDLEFTFNAPSDSSLSVDLSIEQGIEPGVLDYWMPNYDTGSNWFIAIPNTELNLDTVTATDWRRQAVVPIGGGGTNIDDVLDVVILSDDVGRVASTSLLTTRFNQVDAANDRKLDLIIELDNPGTATFVGQDQLIIDDGIIYRNTSNGDISLSGLSDLITDTDFTPLTSDLTPADVTPQVTFEPLGTAVQFFVPAGGLLVLIDGTLLVNEATPGIAPIGPFTGGGTVDFVANTSEFTTITGGATADTNIDNRIAGTGIEDLDGIPALPTTTGTTQQQLVYVADTATFAWSDATTGAAGDTNVNADVLLDSFSDRTTTPGFIYQGRFRRLITGNVASFEIRVLRGEIATGAIDSLVSTGTDQTATQAGFSLIAADPTSVTYS